MKKVRFEEPIYTYHIDFVGHVNNIIYVQWMENARVKLFEAMKLSFTEISQKDEMLPIITETTIHYKKPFYLDNRVYVEIWVSKLFNASAIFEIRFYNEKDELCSTGHQKVLFINKDTMRPSRNFTKFRNAFEEFLIDEK